ncbi:ankyrin repeat-containing protein At5g02620-like [Impatiens glandulifera]|uniref:ankyrin repeat-containing protein At5g02620-like n=1 Tax=Impatiens glandulifera TaxID=253017 RepID=UPI001FB0C426|nr:ankyrin repeat-containing protein At5g02620-like [Impatiens glandulifera]
METKKEDESVVGLDKNLYEALMKGEGEKVIEICKKYDEGPLHVVTIHNDTVLHMATYSKQKHLVLNLLKNLPDHAMTKITTQNGIGNTILHEAATSNRIVPAALYMLERAPDLLEKRNKRGETALFRAARYGKAIMFRFLEAQVKDFLISKKFQGDELVEARLKFYQRDDKTTILHISIITEHFDLALHIAKEHPYLVNSRDEDGMTALQLLACNSSAFKNGIKKKSCFTRLIQSCFSSEVTMVIEEEDQPCVRVPLWEAIRMRNHAYETAVDLAKFLIQRDTSWKETESAVDRSKPKTHKYGSTSFASDGSGEITITAPAQDQAIQPQTSSTVLKKKAQTPLFLAAKSGIREIVEELLRLYPQAVEHIDDEGRNILHVAIKYRQIHIFGIVEKMGIPMMRLIRKTDNVGNSILHMVGMKDDDRNVEDMRSPALLLQEDLLLFERVENISMTHFTKHRNDAGETAEVLFAKNNDVLRNEAKDWLRRTAENCSIIAVLIATVAFAAAYTVPGGPNQNTGYPLLENHPFFVIFTLTDVLSLTLALTSVIVFLSILTSGFRMKDFKQSLTQKLMLGVTLLILSVSMMMLAFAATVVLLIRNKEKWTRIALYSVSFFPVCIFAISYLPLYLSLMSTFKYSLRKLASAFPHFSGRSIRAWSKSTIRPRCRADYPPLKISKEFV